MVIRFSGVLKNVFIDFIFKDDYWDSFDFDIYVY
jgi:hypothetical protein